METIGLDLSGAVATITLDRPGGNRINFTMREELRDAIAQVATSDARALIVRGSGADFCRGGDVRDWPGIPSAELRPRIEVFAEALADLRHLEIPTLAAVQGNCRGGGFELALNCDFIIAARSAVFCFPEAASGILTLQAGVMHLAQRIGRAKALELVLLCESVGAPQMAAWNVVNRLSEDADLQIEAKTFADRLAATSSPVVAATKHLLRRWTEKGEAVALAEWYGVSMPIFDRDETQAALRASANAINRAS